jgi:hypothetical protein
MRIQLFCAMAALMFIAAQAHADDPSGEITLTIQNHGCPDAPSVQNTHDTQPVDCIGRTNMTVGSVEINMVEDGFRAKAMYANQGVNGLCLTMMGWPAHEWCGTDGAGKKLFEGHLLLSTMPATLEGHSPGDELSAKLAEFYGQDLPRQLPIMYNVRHFTPAVKRDGVTSRLSTEIVLQFDLRWEQGGRPIE